MTKTTKRPKGRRPELRVSAQELKTLRERLDLTQAELAELLGVGWNTIARWETAQREIPPMAMKLLGYIEREVRGKQRKER